MTKAKTKARTKRTRKTATETDMPVPDVKTDSPTVPPDYEHLTPPPAKGLKLLSLLLGVETDDRILEGVSQQPKAYTVAYYLPDRHEWHCRRYGSSGRETRKRSTLENVLAALFTIHRTKLARLATKTSGDCITVAIESVRHPNKTAPDVGKVFSIFAKESEEPIRIEREWGVMAILVGPLPAGYRTEPMPLTAGRLQQSTQHLLAPERFQAESATTAEAISADVDELHQRLDQIATANRAVLQDYLNRIEEKSFGSFAANKRVATALQRLIGRMGFRVKCPRCNKAAILRCSKAGNMKNGVFQFEHSTGGKTTNHSGGTLLPRLKLVPKDPPGPT